MKRFWTKVNIKNIEDCWEWNAFKTKKFGYGAFRLNGRMHNAHRISWLLSRGEIPAGICVLHKCDNPPCVNPAHLFLGTQADNVKDCKAKGRTQRYNAKKSHCPKGHPYEGLNLKLNKYGHRACKTCDRLAHRKIKDINTD